MFGTMFPNAVGNDCLGSLKEKGIESRINVGKEEDSRLRSKWEISELVTGK